jgi:hypothetical protein
MVIAVTATLVLSAAAPAKTQKYEGQVFDTLAAVDFKLEREDGKLFATHFHVTDFPYTCPNGTSGTVDIGIRKMRVRDRRFSGTTYFGTNFRRRKSADVVGRLRPRGRAKGTVYYENKFDAVSLCESGEMGWGAQR